MGILVVNEYGKDTREVPLFQDQVRIGRDPRGEIVLADTGVSRSHARIVREEQGVLVEDLGSRNGTLVNDQKLDAGEKRLLRHGDLIRVGRSVLQLLVKISRKITDKLLRSRDSCVAVEETTERKADEPPVCLFLLKSIESRLVVVSSTRSVLCHKLRSDRVRIGRSAASDIVLSDPTVSEDHAEIVYNREGFHLVDRDSRLGTFVDGVAVHVSRLTHRSFIRFGKLKSLFVIEREGAEPLEPSFRLRDHLLELYEEREEAIQRAFRDSREGALDFAEELVTRGVLDPEEWWAAGLDFQEGPAAKSSRWISRLLPGRRKKRQP